MCIGSKSIFSTFLLALASVIGIYNYKIIKNYFTKQYTNYFPQKTKI